MVSGSSEGKWLVQYGVCCASKPPGQLEGVTYIYLESCVTGERVVRSSGTAVRGDFLLLAEEASSDEDYGGYKSIHSHTRIARIASPEKCGRNFRGPRDAPTAGAPKWAVQGPIAVRSSSHDPPKNWLLVRYERDRLPETPPIRTVFRALPQQRCPTPGFSKKSTERQSGE